MTLEDLLLEIDLYADETEAGDTSRHDTRKRIVEQLTRLYKYKTRYEEGL